MASRDGSASVRRIEGILALSITLALVLIAASAVLAVRAAMMVDRSAHLLLQHVLSAPPIPILLPRMRGPGRCGWGWLGSVIEAVASPPGTILALSGAGSVVQLPAPITVSGAADWRVWGVLTGIVPVAGLIVMASAGVAVRRRLAGMP